MLIQQGLKLRREGKPEEALQRFRQAHETAPSPRTYGQMGLVETTLKRWTDGETHLAVTLANPDDAWVRKNRAFLDQALSLCREHVGDLVITGPAGAEVSVGGTPAGTLPAVPALRVAEGTVEVTATASGYEPYKTTVTIRAGKRSALKIAMSPEPVAAGHEDTPPKVPAAVEPDTKPAAEPDVKSASEPAPAEHEPLAYVDRHFAGRRRRGCGRVRHLPGWRVDGGCKTLRSTVHGRRVHRRHGRTTRKPTAGSSTGLGAAALVAGGIVFFTRTVGACLRRSRSALRRTGSGSPGASDKKTAAHARRGEPR